MTAQATNVFPFNVMVQNEELAAKLTTYQPLGELETTGHAPCDGSRNGAGLSSSQPTDWLADAAPGQGLIRCQDVSMDTNTFPLPGSYVSGAEATSSKRPRSPTPGWCDQAQKATSSRIVEPSCSTVASTSSISPLSPPAQSQRPLAALPRRTTIVAGIYPPLPTRASPSKDDAVLEPIPTESTASTIAASSSSCTMPFTFECRTNSSDGGNVRQSVLDRLNERLAASGSKQLLSGGTGMETKPNPAFKGSRAPKAPSSAEMRFQDAHEKVLGRGQSIAKHWSLSRRQKRISNAVREGEADSARPVKRMKQSSSLRTASESFKAAMDATNQPSISVAKEPKVGLLERRRPLPKDDEPALRRVSSVRRPLSGKPRLSVVRQTSLEQRRKIRSSIGNTTRAKDLFCRRRLSQDNRIRAKATNCKPGVTQSPAVVGRKLCFSAQGPAASLALPPTRVKPSSSPTDVKLSSFCQRDQSSPQRPSLAATAVSSPQDDRIRRMLEVRRLAAERSRKEAREARGRRLTPQAQRFKAVGWSQCSPQAVKA